MKTTFGCQHRPERLYAWTVPKVHNAPELGNVTCLVCCDCGQSWERDEKRRKAA